MVWLDGLWYTEPMKPCTKAQTINAMPPVLLHALGAREAKDLKICKTIHKRSTDLAS